MRIILSLSAFLFLGVPSLFGASLTLDTAIEQFLENSYDLQIARQEPKKARADLITAKEHPNPIFSVTNEFIDVKHNFGNTARGSDSQLTFGLSYMIETGGKRNRRIDLANHTINLNDIMYDQRVREELVKLIDAYYTLLGDQIDLANAQEDAKAYAKIVSIAKTKFDNGFLSQIEYQKIAMQQIDYDKEVENASFSVAEDSEVLASMLALPYSDITVVAPADSFVQIPPLDELIANIPERPDCKAAKENITVADAAWKLEKSIAIPNVTVSVMEEGFGPYYEPLLGVGIAIPIPVFDKNEGDIEKSRISALQSASLYNKTLRMAKADVLQIYKAVQSRTKVYHSMTKGFNTAKELKEKGEKIFALKGMSALELLDAQKSYREYQKNMTHALIDLQIAQARLKLNSGLYLLSGAK